MWKAKWFQRRAERDSPVIFISGAAASTSDLRLRLRVKFAGQNIRFWLVDAFNTRMLQYCLTQNAKHFVSRSFAEKRGFRLIHGGCAVAPCSRTAASTPKL